jgi:hypothetical protein
VPKPIRRDFDTVVILTHWRIWKERNSRVFESKQHTAAHVFDNIREEITLWRVAGLVVAF